MEMRVSSVGGRTIADKTTGNDEVMFRASNDGGTTFMEKINLSNSSDTESQDVEIAA
jgi:hypothetical protein